MKLFHSETNFKNRLSIFLKRSEKESIRYILNVIRIVFNYLFKDLRPKKFSFQKKEYNYFIHPYNHTWANERAIEVPLIMDKISRLPDKSEILEIGNVLTHYYPIKHDVVDKYENGKNVINEDVVSFNPKKRYDFIFGISTIEHVGWDEIPKDPLKIPAAIRNLRKLLKENGEIVITVPVGYNPHLDKLIKDRSNFYKSFFLKRGLFNLWKQVRWDQVKDSDFNEDARGLAVLIIKKNNNRRS